MLLIFAGNSELVAHARRKTSLLRKCIFTAAELRFRVEINEIQIQNGSRSKSPEIFLYSYLFHGFYIRWLLISLCAQKKKAGILFFWRHLATSKESSNQIVFLGKDIFYIIRATCSELPSCISTTGWLCLSHQKDLPLRRATNVRQKRREKNCKTKNQNLNIGCCSFPF